MYARYGTIILINSNYFVNIVVIDCRTGRALFYTRKSLIPILPYAYASKMEHVAKLLRTHRRYRGLSLRTQKDKSSATSHPDILRFSWADGAHEVALIRIEVALIRKLNQTPPKHKYALA